MIDFSKTTFEWCRRQPTDDVIVEANLVLTSKQPVSVSAYKIGKLPPEFVENRLRERLWNDAYGELLRPLNELIRLAIYHVPVESSPRVVELASKLHTLLTRPKISVDTYPKS